MLRLKSNKFYLIKLLIFDRNQIPMQFPVITRILSISVSQTCGSLILLRGNLGKSRTRILSISVSQTCGSLILLKGNVGKSRKT